MNSNATANLVPGGPGRPKGALNHTTREVRNAARAIVDDPIYRMNLQARLLEGKAPHMETLLWHYAYGKPKETIEERLWTGRPPAE